MPAVVGEISGSKMNPLPVIIFIIKCLARSIFNWIHGKHGLQALQISRRWEKLSLKLEKIDCDLDFLLKCKKSSVIPKFAKPKLSIYASTKIKQKIGRTIIEAELTNKHRERKKTKRELKELSTQLSTELSFIAHQSLKYRVRNLVRTKKKQWKKTHAKKMENLKAQLRNSNLVVNEEFKRNVVHNFSSYDLKDEEVEALSFGIDHYIPVKTDKRRIEVEFELFYKNVLLGISDLPEDERIGIKTGLLNACKRYTGIKVPYKHQEVVKKPVEKQLNLAIKTR